MSKPMTPERLAFIDTVGVLGLEDYTPDLIAAVREAWKERDEARAENTKLRAALAMSDRPCVYCTLPAEEHLKCAHGFPGCARADDAMGCPHFGASLRADSTTAENRRLKEQIAENANRSAATPDAIRDKALKEAIEAVRTTLREISKGSLPRVGSVEGYGEPLEAAIRALRTQGWV